MLLVDDRAGSQELIFPLRKLGLEVESTRLDFGDVAFEGRGEKGRAVSIGLEFKTLPEFVQALRTQRLQGHQLPGMRGTKDQPGPYDYSYLLVEGELLYDKVGQLLKRKRFSLVPLPGRMTVGELLKRKQVLHLCGGLNPIFTSCRKYSLQEIVALYRCWTDQDLDKHKSHLAIYEAPPLIPISPSRRTYKTLPHIGMRASLAIEQHFGTDLARALAADVSEWAGIEVTDDKGKTRRLGIRVAEDIVAYCRGEQ